MAITLDMKLNPASVGDEIIQLMPDVQTASVDSKLNRLKRFFTVGQFGQATPVFSKPDDLVKHIHDNFYFDSEGVSALNGFGERTGRIEAALSAHASGHKLDAVGLAELQAAHEGQITAIKDMREAVRKAEEAIHIKLGAPVEAIRKHVEAVKTNFQALVGANGTTLVDNSALNTLKTSGVIEIPAHGTAGNLIFKAHSGDIVLGKITAAGAITLDTAPKGGMALASEAARKWEAEMMKVPKQVVDQVKAKFNAVRTQLGVYEAQANEVASKLLPAAEKLAPVVAATSSAITDTANFATKTGSTELLKTSEALHITNNAKNLGVMGEEAGLMSRIKANLYIDKLEKNAQGAVEAVGRSGAKSMAVGAGALAGVGAIAVGINGLMSTQVGEDGQPRSSNSGDYIKNGGLIVGGVAAAALLALGKGKTLGHIVP